MKQILTFGCLLICTFLLVGGCGNSEYKLTRQDLAAFKESPPEMKQAWENGLKADKANDYQTASTSYRSLLKMEMTPEQLVAVQTALGGLNVRMNDAAAKGDAAAQKALEASKEGSARR